MPNDQMKAAEASSINVTESLIAEPLCVRVSLDRDVARAIPHGAAPAFNAKAPLPPETARIVSALKRICEVEGEVTFMLSGYPHKIIPRKGTKGTSQVFRENCVYGVRIAVVPVVRDRQHIYAEFHVMRNIWNNGEPAFYLECEGDPTTVMTGNNLCPVTIRDRESGQTEPYPSSAPQVLNLVNRSLFHFLEVVAQAVAPSKTGLFSAETREAISNGDFRVSHIQWACYAATPAAPFLKILSAMFSPPTDMGEGHPTLAECLGLDFERRANKRTHRLKSILLIKRHADEIVWSLSFYDKKVRVGQTKQGGTLLPEERALVDNNVRIDMTAQSRAIRQLIGAAKSFLRKQRALFRRLPDAAFADEFLAQEIKPTVRQIEFAVFILSHKNAGGKLVRGSFADYLIPKVLERVVPLRRIVAFTVDGLRAMERSEEPVAIAWRTVKMRYGENWVQSLCKAARLKRSKVYKDRKHFWRLHKIDISIPYAFYRRFETHPSFSLWTDEDRDALRDARDGRDGDALLHLFDNADARFFPQMKALAGDPLLQAPISLPMKVLGEIKLPPAEPANAISKAEASAPSSNVAGMRSGRRSLKQPWTPMGLSGRLSIFHLFKAKREAEDQISLSPSAHELKKLRRRRGWIIGAIHKKRDSRKKAKETRRSRKLERPAINALRFNPRRPEPSDDR